MNKVWIHHLAFAKLTLDIWGKNITYWLLPIMDPWEAAKCFYWDKTLIFCSSFITGILQTSNKKKKKNTEKSWRWWKAVIFLLALWHYVIPIHESRVLGERICIYQEFVLVKKNKLLPFYATICNLKEILSLWWKAGMSCAPAIVEMRLKRGLLEME